MECMDAVCTFPNMLLICHPHGVVLDGRNLSYGEHEGISFIPAADSIKVHEFYAQNVVEKL
jgi:hypothetical protein